MHISKLEKIVLPLQLISCLSSFTSITSSTFYIPSVACLWQLREDARTCCSLIAAVTCNVQRVMGNMQHAARSSAIRRSQLRSQGTRQDSLGKMRENISRATDHTTFNNWQCASNVAFSVYSSCHLCLSPTWPFISLHKIAFAALPTIVNVILTADSPQTPSLTNARRKIISLGQQIVGLLFLCLYILILFIFFIVQINDRNKKC